ncbi:hypothetical protein [Jatrophihabitans sp.]|uniref:hypothetical protein n=1 Tax=Jatrophihabitans sp. TaxID=1932789 RepID=UPI0030C6DB90|nr:hypothetical protein [Jatrophihabitans sp.]
MTPVPVAFGGFGVLGAGAFVADQLTGGTSVPQTLIAIGTAIAAILAAIGGWQARRQRVDMSELGRLRTQVGNLRTDVLALSGYSFSLRNILAQNGIPTPEPPRLRSEDPEPPDA